MFLDPPRPADRDRLQAYFLSLEQACKRLGGVKRCKCSTDKKWVIDSLDANMTNTLFCLPEACICNKNPGKEAGRLPVVINLKFVSRLAIYYIKNYSFL